MFPDVASRILFPGVSSPRSIPSVIIARAAEARSVLRRIVSIVDAFDGSQRVLSLGELSSVTRLPKSTVHRYAEQLVDMVRELETPSGQTTSPVKATIVGKLDRFPVRGGQVSGGVDVRAAGAQVVLVSDCGPGTGCGSSTPTDRRER